MTQGYHSVRGEVGGPGMAFMTYGLYQAYPSYLVTYRAKA